MTQYELNEALWVASRNCQMEEIAKLLKNGADPLGSTTQNDKDEHLLGDLFCEASDNDDVAEKLPDIVKMFLDYGMNIASRNIPKYDGNNINPLWELQFVRNEYALKTLKVLLDYNLDIDSAEALVDHIFTDTDMCDGCDIDDEWFYDTLCIHLKMVMLISSYPHIIENSEYIRRCIDVKHNNIENLSLFGNWSDYEYCVDISTCTNIPYGLQNATLNIKDIMSGKIVWTCLI